MMTISNRRQPRSIPNPVTRAQGYATLATMLGTTYEGFRLTTMTDLSADANGPHTRKRESHHSNDHSKTIVRYLQIRHEELYFPYANKTLRDESEGAHGVRPRLAPEFNKTPDVVAMLHGDHIAVVALGRSDVGKSLLDGGIELTVDFDCDNDPRRSPIERVQRANALDVLAVLAWADPMFAK